MTYLRPQRVDSIAEVFLTNMQDLETPLIFSASPRSVSGWVRYRSLVLGGEQLWHVSVGFCGDNGDESSVNTCQTQVVTRTLQYAPYRLPSCSSASESH